MLPLVVDTQASVEAVNIVLEAVWCDPHPDGDVGVVETFRYMPKQLPLTGGELYFGQHHADILLDGHGPYLLMAPARYPHVTCDALRVTCRSAGPSGAPRALPVTCNRGADTVAQLRVTRNSGRVTGYA